MTDWLSRMFVRDYGRVNDPGVRVSYGIMAGVVGIVLNVALCVAKAAVADAVNNLSDASSNIVTLTGFKLASKPADSGHPYGHGRFEYLAGLVVAVLVTAVGFEIIRGGISRIIDPEPVEVSLPLLIVMLLSIAAKAWMMSFNKKLGDRIESETLAATAIDSRNDVITTTAVLVCALVSRFTGLELDGWAGLAVGIFVLVSGLALVRDTVNPLLGEAPSQEMVDRVVSLVLATPGILGVHDLMIHDYGPGRKVASAHAEMDSRTSLLTAHTTLDGIERRVAFETGITLTLHCDPIDVSQVRKRPKAGGTPAGRRK